ncbi:MAG: glutamate 5-kinase [Clostridia bacterium]|nr:glutamate 5-kinase [Clostridia bacterium]
MSLKDAKRIVFKVGTSTLTHQNGKPDYKKLEELVRILADLKNDEREVVLVSSGAISVGVDRMRLSERPSTIAGKQAAAAVGQCELMFIYDKLFSEYNKVVAQVLMTRDAVDTKERRQNVVNTFSELLKMDVIPVVNENDTVATEELVFGDNDTLSAIVAQCVDADALVIITDIDGLYDKNPQQHDDAKIIPVVTEITDHLYEIAGGSGTNRGTGGMFTKIQAAEIASKSNIDMVILSGNDLHKIYDLLNGEQVGTLFKFR